jgi:hypothetical protein
MVLPQMGVAWVTDDVDGDDPSVMVPSPSRRLTSQAVIGQLHEPFHPFLWTSPSDAAWSCTLSLCPCAVACLANRRRDAPRACAG